MPASFETTWHKVGVFSDGLDLYNMFNMLNEKAGTRNWNPKTIHKENSWKKNPDQSIVIIWALFLFLIRFLRGL